MATKRVLFDKLLDLKYRPQFQYGLKSKTIKEYDRLITKLIRPEFQGRLLASFTQAGVDRWHKALAQAAPFQANRALAVLQKLLQLAVDDRILEYNPARGVKRAKETSREAYLNSKQRELLLETIKELPPVEGSYLLTLFYTGARPGELQSANWKWLHGDLLQLPDSKTGKRTIYLPPAALSALSVVRNNEKEQSGPIFPGVNYENLWKRVKRRAELQGVRLYDLRHTFASAALSAGLSLEVVSQLLGHRDPRTTRRYAHLETAAGRAAVADTAKALHGG